MGHDACYLTGPVGHAVQTVAVLTR